MNVYDFDNTIYKGDSSVDFWVFSLKKNPQIIVLLPYQLFMAVLYKCKMVDKVKFKEAFFSFLKMIPDVERNVKFFWDIKQSNIKEWYMEQQKDDDLVISASPFFLLNEICTRIGIKNLIATDVDIKIGTFHSANCYGEEKLRMYKERFGNEPIECFYTDSYSDLPLLKKAECSYIVKGDDLKRWST